MYFRKIIIGFLSVICVFLFGVLGFLFSNYFVFTDEDFQKTVVIDEGYEFFIHTFSENIEIDELSVLDPNDYKNIFYKVIEKKDFSDFVEYIIYQIKTNQVTSDGEIVIDFSLEWFLDKQGLFAQEVTDILYEKLPVCKDSVSLYNMEVIDCVPKNLDRGSFERQIALKLDINFFSSLSFSNEISVFIPMEEGKTILDFLSGIFWKIVFVIIGILIFKLLTIGFLLRKSFKKILKFQGILLLVSLVFMFLIFIVFYLRLEFLSFVYIEILTGLKDYFLSF